MTTLYRLLILSGVAALYLGAGALLHAVLVGPSFVWDSAWTWGMLLAWPLALYAGMLLVSAVCAACIIIWEARRG